VEPFYPIVMPLLTCKLEEEEEEEEEEEKEAEEEEEEMGRKKFLWFQTFRTSAC
jgi:hypothetical protein